MRRSLSILFLICGYSLVASGDEPLQLPVWLTPAPQAANLKTAATQTEISSAYTAPALPSEIVKSYEQELREAHVTFVAGFNGIGPSIRASADKVTCVVTISELDSPHSTGSRVDVLCTATPNVGAVPGSSRHSANAGVPAGELPPGEGRIVEDWPLAHWGMSQQEVLDSFHGDAKVLTDDQSRRQFINRIATIGIDDVTVGDVRLRALFLFDSDGGLDRILLDTFNRRPATADDFERIESSLASKHGEPLRGAAHGIRFSSVWLLPNSVIDLDYVTSVGFTLTFDKRINQAPATLLTGLTYLSGRHRLAGTPIDGREDAMTLVSVHAGSSAGARAQARASCERFVSQRLKAPATAKFGPASDTEVTGFKGGTYRIAGWVDAQNSFSALVRNRYACWVEHAGETRWTLLSLDLRAGS